MPNDGILMANRRREILAVASAAAMSMMDKFSFWLTTPTQSKEYSMRRKTKTLAFFFALLAWSGYVSALRGEDSRDPSHFTYARLSCAPDGNTHFEDVTVELRKTNFAPPAPPINIGSDFAASRAFFGGFDAGWGAKDLEKSSTILRPRCNSASFCKVAFPSPRPTARPADCIPGACFDWRTPRLARALIVFT